MSDYFESKIEEAKQRIPTMEHMLGKGLNLPYVNTNSGPRKIMSGVHRDHILPLFLGEKAITETGYEIRFGDESSSIETTSEDFRVVAKISKFSFSPNHDYILILANEHTKELSMTHRISYEHSTESYGYLYNNSTIDSVEVGQYIPRNTILRKSLAFDEYMNRKDGANLLTCYMSLDQNMEDSIILSDVAALKFTSPLIKTVRITINENDIPLNLYGSDENYKCIPDIGEDIKNSTLIALRKEKKEEMVFTESTEMLKKQLVSDEARILNGTVIDIDIGCNNVANLEAYHNRQFKMYYNELQRRSQEIISVVTKYRALGYTIDCKKNGPYQLDKLYSRAKQIVSGAQYMDKKMFSNIILDVVVLEHLPMKEGDKIANRYGGKGVCSKILPQKLMPKVKETGKYVDIIMNGSTMYGRMNPGQIFEMSINRVGTDIVQYIVKNNVPVNPALAMIVKFATLISPSYGNALGASINEMSQDDRRYYLDSVIRDGHIDIATLPITDSFTIDRLQNLYKEFPFISKYEIEVPIKTSKGDYRYITSNRRLVVGYEYFFRLKQYAEEKFSATSLSAVNIRGNNTKSKANKNFIEPYSTTPIRCGNMEINSMSHLGAEAVIANLMIHSVSPHARQLVKEMYTTSDPYHINIMLDGMSKNRGAEIVYAFLKTIGRRIVFIKIPKKRVTPFIDPIYFNEAQIKDPIFFPKEGFDYDSYYKYLKEHEDMIKEAEQKGKDIIVPIYFNGCDINRTNVLDKLNEEAYKYINTPERDKIKFIKDSID